MQADSGQEVEAVPAAVVNRRSYITLVVMAIWLECVAHTCGAAAAVWERAASDEVRSRVWGELRAARQRER